MNLAAYYANLDPTELYLKHMIAEGYIDGEGAPLKCPICGCTKHEQSRIYYEEHYEVEYDIVCTKCRKIIGHWAYGSWEV